MSPRDYMRKPEGVMAYVKWVARHPDPTLSELLNRYMQVDAAVIRYRNAGMNPKDEWLAELNGKYRVAGVFDGITTYHQNTWGSEW